jgi:hypothetical protein
LVHTHQSLLHLLSWLNYARENLRCKHLQSALTVALRQLELQHLHLRFQKSAVDHATNQSVNIANSGT